MFIRTIIGAVLVLLHTAPANAFTKKDAEQCVQTLLQGYSAKQAPLGIFDLPRATAKAIGPTHRSMTDEQRAEAIEATKDSIKHAFATSKNKFANIRITSVKKVDGYKVLLLVDIDKNGEPYPDSYAEALVTGNESCGLWQVNIEDIFTLATSINSALRNDPRTKPILENIK